MSLETVRSSSLGRDILRDELVKALCSGRMPVKFVMCPMFESTQAMKQVDSHTVSAAQAKADLQSQTET